MSVAKTTLCVGEETEVKVEGATSAPGTTVRILGVVGSRQFVQFANTPGGRQIAAAVFASDGRADFISVPVTVQKCPAPPDAPRPVAFHFRGGHATNRVEFVVFPRWGATATEPGGSWRS